MGKIEHIASFRLANIVWSKRVPGPGKLHDSNSGNIRTSVFDEV
jgi:hypothetical protein